LLVTVLGRCICDEREREVVGKEVASRELDFSFGVVMVLMRPP
jgi:hypothetical protein